MPYTWEQHKLFEYVKHNPQEAHKKGIKISTADASRMASEGVKGGKTASKAKSKRT
jgi:hypothetical protein